MEVQKKLRVGIIGAGKIANIAHFPVLSSLPDVELSVLFSRTFDKAETISRQFGVKKNVRTFEEFLKEDLDCAVLLTPKTVRRQYIPALLEKKLDLLIEKPLSPTLQECEELADASVKSGQIVMVAFNRRFAPCNKKAIDAFNGKRPHLVIASKNREYKEYRGTMENAIHMVDLLRHILGDCDKVSAAAKFSDPFIEDVCTAQLEFRDGGIGLLAASREAGQWREQVELYGGGITAISDNLDRCRIIYPDREEALDMTPVRQGWCTVVERIGFEGCIKHFIECVHTRAKPLTSAEDAYKTHILLDKILKAAGLPDLSKDWSVEK